MGLLVKVIPLRAGTAESAGDPEVLACPPDVEAGMILSFLTGRFGDLIETAWTSAGRHPRIEAGWIFPGPRGDERAGGVEILCVPFIGTGDGSARPMFEWLADRRQDFEELAGSGALDRYRVIELPQRDCRPAAGEAGEGTRLTAFGDLTGKGRRGRAAAVPSMPTATQIPTQFWRDGR